MCFPPILILFFFDSEFQLYIGPRGLEPRGELAGARCRGFAKSDSELFILEAEVKKGLPASLSLT